MKIENKIVDRGVFIFVWLTIITISAALLGVFVVGFKTVLAL